MDRSYPDISIPIISRSLQDHVLEPPTQGPLDDNLHLFKKTHRNKQIKAAAPRKTTLCTSGKCGSGKQKDIEGCKGEESQSEGRDSPTGMYG
ncbi:hypothetical protein OUZ56_027540 [Daphnia magna]|uniref:Uncharacterized protein n=1 Tax=Daphnia magna TaxID=35525 RepID=A0ABQ9ZQY5_9CRUS|nr:hypothetical protein OUZ56_027540 [Daphnia magna]